jgi:GNAT superfamily N-acetyltransferase
MKPENGSDSGMSLSIRDAADADAPVIARLAGQLGYVVAAREIAGRLSLVTAGGDERVLVAENERGVVGWTACAVVAHIHTGPYVLVSGFVVDQDERGRGIGRLLMAEVEAWARARGVSSVRLNANAKREAAHRFYQALGFRKVKEQYSFQKDLTGA